MWLSSLSVFNEIFSVLVPDDRYWIGLNDFAVEGTFVWTDGSGLSYTDWKSGEPSKGLTEDCVRVEQNDWWDSDCLRMLRYICEFNITI